MVKRSLFDVRQMKPITQYFRLSYCNSVSAMLWTYTKSNSLGHFWQNRIKSYEFYINCNF